MHWQLYPRKKDRPCRPYFFYAQLRPASELAAAPLDLFSRILPAQGPYALAVVPTKKGPTLSALLFLCPAAPCKRACGGPIRSYFEDFADARTLCIGSCTQEKRTDPVGLTFFMPSCALQASLRRLGIKKGPSFRLNLFPCCPTRTRTSTDWTKTSCPAN